MKVYEKNTTINATNDFGIHSPRTKRLLYSRPLKICLFAGIH